MAMPVKFHQEITWIPKKLFRNADLQGIAMNDFLEKHNNEELSPEFTIFNHVINDFKEMNRNYSRTAHPKRRFDADPKSHFTFKDDWSTNYLGGHKLILWTQVNPKTIPSSRAGCTQNVPYGHCCHYYKSIAIRGFLV